MSETHTRQFSTQVDSFVERVAHMAAHFVNGAETLTDECPRDLIAPGHFSIKDQVETVLDILRTEDKETFEELLDDFSDDEALTEDKLSEMLNDDDREDSIEDDLCTWIEDHTMYYWDDGEVFIPTCEFVLNPEDAQQRLDSMIIGFGYRLAVGSDNHHLKLDLAVGGPSASLLRDFGEDRLRVAWWGEVKEIHTDAVTVVLDYHMDYIPDPEQHNLFTSPITE